MGTHAPDAFYKSEYPDRTTPSFTDSLQSNGGKPDTKKPPGEGRL